MYNVPGLGKRFRFPLLPSTSVDLSPAFVKGYPIKSSVWHQNAMLK